MSGAGTTTGMISKTNKGKNTTPTTSMFKFLFYVGYKALSLSTDVVIKLKG